MVGAAVGALRNGITLDFTSLFGGLEMLGSSTGESVGTLSSGSRGTFREWLQSLNLLGSGANLTAAKSMEGMRLPRRLLPSEITTLSEELNREVAVVLRRNNGVNEWYLHVGTQNKIQFNMDSSTYVIYHTHPQGSPVASAQDMEMLANLQLLQQQGAAGTPVQQRSMIVPIGGQKFMFTNKVNSIPIN